LDLRTSGTAAYTVRLHFADPDNAEAGRRVFAVALQGKTVIENLDVAAETGGRFRGLVKEFQDVSVVDGKVRVEFIPRVDGAEGSTAPSPTPERAPILCGVQLEYTSGVLIDQKQPRSAVVELARSGPAEVAED
jgi:hypothetical protein